VVLESPEDATAWHCGVHGRVTPMWRAEGELGYESFATLLAAAGPGPVHLPWPLGTGWRVSDAAVVVDRLDGTGRVQATLTGCSGTSALDGAVDVVVVTEEPGAGLGGRVAGTGCADPGPEVGDGTPAVHVHVGGRTVALWPVSTSHLTQDLDRSVFAGEAFGRWLWMVLWPASAALLLRDDWILRDVSRVGAWLVDLPFGGPAPRW